MRKTILALLVLAAGAGPGVALASEGNVVRIRHLFYDNHGYTEVVGEFVEFCDGTSVWNGYPTAYGTTEEYTC